MNVRRLIPPVSLVLLALNLGGCLSTRCYMDYEELWSCYCQSRTRIEAARRERRWLFSRIRIASAWQDRCAFSCEARPQPADASPRPSSKHSQHSPYDQPLLPPTPAVSPEVEGREGLQSTKPPQSPNEEATPAIIEVEPAPLPVDDASEPERLQAEPTPENIVFPAAPTNTLRPDAPSPTDESNASPAAPRNVIPQNQQP
jgi:hypothetical protein